MRDGDGSPERPVLAVDLDGKLVRSDLLFESFWAAMSHAPVETFRQMLWGKHDRAGLKRHLALKGHVDVAQLPYNDEVIAHIRRWRDGGGRTVLVTAGDQILADQVADHLGLFDEIHGSDGIRNLKGPVKAAFLAERYGPAGYVYMGGDADDLPLWENAAGIVTVNAARGRTSRRQRPPGRSLISCHAPASMGQEHPRLRPDAG